MAPNPFLSASLLPSEKLVARMLLWRVEQCADVLGQVVFHGQPGKLALVIHVEGWLEVFRVFERGGVEVHAAGVVIRDKSHWRAAVVAEMAKDAGRGFKGLGRLPGPGELVHRNPQPGHNRRRTVPAAIIAVAVAGP